VADENNQQPDKKTAPIIIKRINPEHHGHHGGAWKVAYADFVTAMMAFFLLMWLLNSIPADKLQGIAQYFEPTVGIGGSKGIGFQGGKAQSSEGTSNYDKQKGVKYGVLSVGEIISTPKKGTEVTIEEMENERFTMLEGELKKSIMADKALESFQDNISFEITPEGLVIKIVDQDKYPMFKQASAELEVYTKNILNKIANLIRYSPNFISISGHTDSDLASSDAAYSNWELSADRALATRRYLVLQGIPRDQIARIVGKADVEPEDPANPNSPRNRRVTITLLRKGVDAFNKVSAPKQMRGEGSEYILL
jgi:chemotaxis protein MotB